MGLTDVRQSAEPDQVSGMSGLVGAFVMFLDLYLVVISFIIVMGAVMFYELGALGHGEARRFPFTWTLHWLGPLVGARLGVWAGVKRKRSRLAVLGLLAVGLDLLCLIHPGFTPYDDHLRHAVSLYPFDTVPGIALHVALTLAVCIGLGLFAEAVVERRRGMDKAWEQISAVLSTFGWVAAALGVYLVAMILGGLLGLGGDALQQVSPVLGAIVGGMANAWLCVFAGVIAGFYANWVRREGATIGAAVGTTITGFFVMTALGTQVSWTDVAWVLMTLASCTAGGYLGGWMDTHPEPGPTYRERWRAGWTEPMSRFGRAVYVPLKTLGHAAQVLGWAVLMGVCGAGVAAGLVALVALSTGLPDKPGAMTTVVRLALWLCPVAGLVAGYWMQQLRKGGLLACTAVGLAFVAVAAIVFSAEMGGGETVRQAMNPAGALVLVVASVPAAVLGGWIEALRQRRGGGPTPPQPPGS